MSESSLPGFAIPTRQENDVLFSTKSPLLSGTRTIPIKKVAGYAALPFFATANAAFELRLSESCVSKGPFAQTRVLTSSSAGSKERICERVLQCGAFMKVEIVPLAGPLTELEVCGQGIPLP